MSNHERSALLSRRGFLRTCGALTGTAALSSLDSAGQSNRAPRHIVLCVADDLGWHETGYRGHARLKTPVLDEMASSGLRFDRFYAAAPVCSPTRGSIMTGRHPNRYGTFAPNYAIRPEEVTIAQLLRQQGYATGLFGKWHLGPSRAGAPNNPGNMGFDEWVSTDNFFGHSPLMSRNGAEPERHHGESSETVVRQALRFFEDQVRAGKPSFTMVCFGSPHEPYSPMDDDMIPYVGLPDRLQQRFGEITAMDRAMGQLREGIRKTGVREDTLLWFVSDNGTPTPDVVDTHLRGSKGNVYEGGVRVPALIEWPARVPQPRVTEMRAVTSDILPTLCELTGAAKPQRPLDGISLVPLLNGVVNERKEAICFWRYDTQREAQENPEPYLDPATQRGNIPTSRVRNIQFMNYRHRKARTSDFGGMAAITGPQYKLVVTPEGEKQLFDLKNDDAEKTDMASQKPELVKQLLAELEDWQRSVERSLTAADYSR
jgi:arylsulfatase A-like enzyme